VSDEHRIQASAEQRIEITAERAALLRALLGFTQKLSDFDLLSLVAEVAAGSVPRFRPSQVIGELSAIAQTYEAARRALEAGANAADVFGAQSDLWRSRSAKSEG